MAARILLVLALLLIVAVAVVAIFARSRQDTTGLASPTPTATATATPNPSPTSTPSPTLSPSSSPTTSASATATFVGAPYVNTTWQYSLVLPPPYRHSDILSFKSPPPDPGQPKGSDAFTPRTPQDEASLTSNCETDCEIWNYVARVEVWTDVGAMTAREWATSNRFGHASGEQIVDVTVDGHPAVKVTNGTRGPVAYVVANAGRMYVLSYKISDLFPVPPGGSKEKLEAILASFKFGP